MADQRGLAYDDVSGQLSWLQCWRSQCRLKQAIRVHVHSHSRLSLQWNPSPSLVDSRHQWNLHIIWTSVVRCLSQWLLILYSLLIGTVERVLYIKDVLTSGVSLTGAHCSYSPIYKDVSRSPWTLELFVHGNHCFQGNGYSIQSSIVYLIQWVIWVKFWGLHVIWSKFHSLYQYLHGDRV